MGVGSFYYLNGNYVYGVADHANAMKSDIPWASAGIAGDAMALMQSVATSGASALGAAKFAAAAATPIINAGLITLTVAGNQLGFGRPEDGERFATGSDHFGDAWSTLRTSVPPEDWQGSGSEAYGTRNEEQRDRAALMSGFDRSVQTVLADEAAQVENTREFVSKRQTALGLSIAPAIAAKAIPVAGPAISIAIEIAAVAATVPFAAQRVSEMVSHAGTNAQKIRQIAEEYESVAAATQAGGKD